MTFYSDAERTAAVALVESGMTQMAVAERLGIPLSTLNQWCTSSRRSADGDESSEHVNNRIAWAAVHADASRMGAEVAREQMQRYRGQELKPHELRDVMISAGIATDKALDLLDGRKGAQVPNVDARQLHFHVTPEQARALLEEATRLAPVAPVDSVSSSSEPLSLP